MQIVLTTSPLSPRKFRADVEHGLQRCAFDIVLRAHGRRHLFAVRPITIELIAAADTVPPAAPSLGAGDPKPEQVALRLRHPRIPLLVGQHPPLRERPAAGIFLFQRGIFRFAPTPPLAPSFSPRAGRRPGMRGPSRYAQNCPRHTDRCHRLQVRGRGSAPNRDALAFRRFAAALATGYYPDGSAPDPCFLGRGLGGWRLGAAPVKTALQQRCFFVAKC
jgi:hypothetical protein